MFNEIPPANGVLIHPGAIGDCLLTLPLAAYLKKNLNLNRLDFIGRREYIEFYPGRTCIDHIRSLESIQMHRLFEEESAFVLEDKDRLSIAFESYEQIVSFLGYGHRHFENNLLFTVHSTHSAEITLLPLSPAGNDRRHVCEFYVSFLRDQLQLENAPTQTAPTITPFASDFAAGQDLVERLGLRTDQPVVLIQPGSGSVGKCWHLQNFLQTASHLKAVNCQVVFLLGEVELARFCPADLNILSDRWPVLKSLSLTQVLQVLTQVELFLGNDSGISHLAAALGKPTIALFGPAGNPVHYQPLGKQVFVLHPDPESFSAPMASESDKVVSELIKHL